MARERRAGETWRTPREAAGMFLRGATFGTAARVSLLVGTILSVVNQGDKVADGTANTGTWVRIGVNYLVPFLVSSYGFLAARRAPAPG